MRAFMEPEWIKDYDALVEGGKRSNATMVAYNTAVRFFKPDDDNQEPDTTGETCEEEPEELTVHETVDCAERLIDDLNLRCVCCLLYTSPSPRDRG